MNALPPNQRYHWIPQLLHWVIAGLIAANYFLADLAQHAEDNDEKLRQLALLASHKSVGITVLMLALLRLAVRFVHRPPRLPATMPRWQTRASHASHFLMYALIFLIPLSGWMMSSAASYSVSWFGFLTLPDLVGVDPDLRHRFNAVHEALNYLLYAIVLLHVLAALKHHFLDRDEVLRRMLSPLGLAAGLLALGGAYFVLSGAGAPQQPAPASPAAPAVSRAPVASDAPDSIDAPISSRAPVAQVAEPPVPHAGAAAQIDLASPPAEAALPFEPPRELALWKVDAGRSRIEFTADQAGAPFTGKWPTWRSTLRFDRSRLADGKLDVVVDVTQVDSKDPERDATLMEADWFDSTRHPTVRFRSGAIKAANDGFTTNAILTVKGREHPVIFRFRVLEEGARRTLEGSARLDRLALGLGTGEWQDTEWVGQYVEVSVTVIATVAASE